MALWPSYHTGFFFVVVPEASATILYPWDTHLSTSCCLEGLRLNKRLGGRIYYVHEEVGSEEQLQAREEQRERREWADFLEILSHGIY